MKANFYKKSEEIGQVTIQIAVNVHEYLGLVQSTDQHDSLMQWRFGPIADIVLQMS